MPAAQFLRRQFRRAALLERDVDQRRKQGHVFGRVQADERKSVLEIGEAPLGRDLGAAEPLAAPLRDRVQGRVLQELRGGPFDPGVRRLAEARAELLDQARLADAGLADDLNELALALKRPRPSAHDQRELVLAADERRPASRAAATAAPARAHDAVERDRRRHAPELMLAPVLGDEQARGLALHRRGDDHGARLGGGLHARSDVRRISEHLAQSLDHDRARVEADARRKLRRAGLRVAGVEVGERALDGERRPHRAFAIVLLRDGKAE